MSTDKSSSKAPSSHTPDVIEKQAIDGSASSSFDNTSNESGLVEDDYGSQGGHIFEDGQVTGYWRGVYEKATYEGRHRFDPSFKWTAKEEKKLLRKVTLSCVSSVLPYVILTSIRRSRSIWGSCYGLG